MARKRLIIGIFALLLFGLVLVTWMWLQPLAERFQGKTVREWCGEFTKSGEIPSDDVVEAFGTRAVPEVLYYMTISSHVYEMRLALQLAQSQDNNPGAQTAYEWMRKLQAKDQTVFDQLLNSDSKSASTLLQTFALSDPVMKQKLAAATNNTMLRKK